MVHRNTGISWNYALALNEKLNVLPKGMNFHPNIVKVYENRYKSIKAGKGMQWEVAEQLAWATLLEEGYSIRVAGEDVERGTFTHRHSVIYDQDTQESYTP